MLDKQLQTTFFVLVEQELKRARDKFPTGTFDRWKCLAALTEEVGELNQAVLQHEQEPDKNKTVGDVLKEAVQVAVMAARVILDTEVMSLDGPVLDGPDRLYDAMLRDKHGH